MNAAAAWILRVAVGGLFVVAGLLKLRDPAGFAVEIANYQLFPAAAPFLAAALPATEIVLGLAAIAAPAPWRRASALALAGLLLAFTGAAASALGRHINIDCGCFGDSGGPITGLTIVRDLVLLAAAGALVALDGRSVKV